ncbi:MAG TPA: outer membrane protein assembly factor BamB [Thiobacillaceae bacterium]|nr:outer membrane protein assembly factor BamB [Thiobacillaceae bacterium]HNU63362.1 outer membrane protein assembly factor BamB [Thiobacillaceae bacterium]
MHSTVYVLPVVLALAGCSSVTSTLGGWFGAGKTTLKPAELVEFKPSVGLARAWEATVGSAGPYIFSPATDGQFVYAAARDGRIIKLDLASGREIWRVEAGQVLSAGVGVGAGLVLVGTPKGEVLAYHARDGAPAWIARLSGEILVPPVAGDGMVAARGNNGHVYLLQAADGKLRWDTERTLPALTLREQSHMLLTPEALYVGHAGGRLSALALNNGASLWESNVALPRGTTELERIADVVGPLALDGARICAAAYQGRVACFDPARGSGLWARDVSARRGVDMDGRMLYVVDERGALLAFDKIRGTNPWKQDRLRDRDLSSPVAVAERYVAVGDFQGYVHLVDTDDGAFSARVPTDGSAIRGVMLPLKSGLVAQTAQGGIYALKIQ